MIDVYDDVLDIDSAIAIDNTIQKLKWRYYYPSDRDKPNRHWHILCGNNKEECEKNGYHWAHVLFDVYMNKLEFTKNYKIDGIDKFVSSYYQLRYNDERYNQEIEGGPLYGAWVQSIGGNIQLDNNENMGNTTDIHSNIMDQLN